MDTPPRGIAIRGLAKPCDSNRLPVKKNRGFRTFFHALCNFDAEVGVTAAGKSAGIYCDQPAKILEVETQDRHRATDPHYQAFCSAI